VFGAPLRNAPIRVAVAIAERALRERVAHGLRESESIVFAAVGDADVTIADGEQDLAGPVIVLGRPSKSPARPSDVRAVLPVDVAPAVLAAVITVIAAGLAVAPPRGTPEQTVASTGRWTEALDNPGADDDESPVTLTAREREVLTLLAAGASNKSIARALGVSVHTAKFHVASLTEKLGASGRLEAVAIALRTGLIMV
jgi:DNA-binding CsgD family transcriptional regulator